MGKECGVDAQMFFPEQMPRQGLEKGADGKIDAASILDERGHACPNLVKNLIHGPPGKIDHRLGGQNEVIEVINVNKGITISSGDLFVDFPHYQRCLFHGLSCHVDSHTETGIACFIGR